MTSCPYSTAASRRNFLRGAGGAAGGLLAASTASLAQGVAAPPRHAIAAVGSGAGHATEPFWGAHQAGILTPPQSHSYFAAFDIAATSRKDIAALLQRWTVAAARMSAGQTAAPPSDDRSKPAADPLDALGLAPARLTLTFGFGPGLFSRNGKDRFGLAAHRPAALVDLPRFAGDQMSDARVGGDLSVQACADDPQVAFHAVRQLAATAYGTAQIRWAQTGFSANSAAAGTPRNLMGFKDGTQSPRGRADLLWAGEEGPAWMRGGSYLVARRIRVSLEHWDRTEVDFQEQVIGRRKLSGAPLNATHEFDPIDLAAQDADGNPVIAENAHIRLATAASNGGAEILRRGYAYNDGVAFTAERWPPWRQGMLYDAGLFFVCYQRDPRTGFIRIFETMAKLDALNQFTTHTGGGLFACPPGALQGGYIGQALLDA